jgi:hypothetical protein
MMTLQQHFDFHTYNIAQAYVMIEYAMHYAELAKKANKYKELYAHLENLVEKHVIDPMGEICSAREQIEMLDLTEAEFTTEADKLLDGFLNPSKKADWD